MEISSNLFRASSSNLSHVLPSSSSSFCSSSFRNVKFERMLTMGVKASVAAASKESSVAASDVTKVGEAIDLSGHVLGNVSSVVVKVVREALKPKVLRKLHVQNFIEKTIIDCRFFTLFAVAGSLLGSVVCFIEGSFLVLESYLQYFHMLSHKSDEGHIVVHLLIEAIDMFLIGMAMLIFGMGLYSMFVGFKNLKLKSPLNPSSNFFGLFHFKAIPKWIEMNSISEAKSKMGHAMMMILQVGLLEKFKTIPLVTSLDLACFAASVLASSASVFILSKLSTGKSIP